jgi:hypothetical protein
MPKRSNDFQKLIFLIEQNLAQQNATVRESVLLRDHRTGEQRELDILIETLSGVHPFTIAIECIDHSRPASVTWVEQIRQKHEDVPVNKTILVSRSGFSKAARLKAALFDMETISLQEALSADWGPLVTQRLGVFNLTTCVRHPINVKVHLFPPPPEGLDRSQLSLHTPTGEPLDDARTILERSVFMSPTIQAVEETLAPGTSTIVGGEVKFPPGTHAIDRDGNKYELLSWTVEATISKEHSSVPLKNASYTPSASVAYGTLRQFGLQGDVLFLEKEGEPGLSFTVCWRTPGP